MHRPIGITILALLAGLAGLFEIWRALVFLGVVSFEFHHWPDNHSQRGNSLLCRWSGHDNEIGRGVAVLGKWAF